MTTTLDELIGESNMVKSSGHESKYISVLYSQLSNQLLLYIQLGVGNYIVYNKEYVYARILFTNDPVK